ncbi:uncharacterized protein EDB91DRAFT_1113719, partial [Suillus paluster]|uniref:uncharacterized protein n=1 Tax=Suillus paluster TaxID=48578 RepID=UPI001B86EB64
GGEAPSTDRRITSSSRFANSRLSLRIPEDQDPYSDDRSVQGSSDTSPVTPKHKLPLPHIPLSPSRYSIDLSHHSPHRLTPSPQSLLPSPLHSGHGDHHFSRKLFHRKRKERASSEPLEDWEVLDPHHSPPSPAPAPSSGFAETWPYPDVFTEDTRVSVANRHPYRPSVRTVPPAEERPQRPASPPFVNRHIRRRTSSSLRSDHVSASRALQYPQFFVFCFLFSSSSLSLATVGRTLPQILIHMHLPRPSSTMDPEQPTFPSNPHKSPPSSSQTDGRTASCS